MCLLVVLTGLQEGAHSRWLFRLAVAAAVVASYSSVPGPVIWPVGLAYCLIQGLPRFQLWSWVAWAVAPGFVLFWQLGLVCPPAKGPTPSPTRCWGSAPGCWPTALVGWLAHRRRVSLVAIGVFPSAVPVLDHPSEGRRSVLSRPATAWRPEAVPEALRDYHQEPDSLLAKELFSPAERSSSPGRQSWRRAGGPSSPERPAHRCGSD
jgi:hypothetical protein